MNWRPVAVESFHVASGILFRSSIFFFVPAPCPVYSTVSSYDACSSSSPLLIPLRVASRHHPFFASTVVLSFSSYMYNDVKSLKINPMGPWHHTSQITDDSIDGKTIRNPTQDPEGKKGARSYVVASCQSLPYLFPCCYHHHNHPISTSKTVNARKGWSSRME